jgi:hypothetical protein
VSLPAGWYAASGVLKDVYDKISTGFAAAVRIAQDHNTTMALALHALPTSGGGGFTFSWNGIGELQISGTPAPGTDIHVYGSTAVPMQVTSPEGGFTVTWYLDGQVIGTGADFLLDPSYFLIDDTYRLDAIAISADLQRAASLTWTVYKGMYSPDTVRVSGKGNVDVSFPSGWWMKFTLRSTATPEVIYGTVMTDCGTMTYSFDSVPPGTYYLRNEVQGGYSRWWSADGGVAGPYGEVITVPTAPGAKFDFLAGHGF